MTLKTDETEKSTKSRQTSKIHIHTNHVIAISLLAIGLAVSPWLISPVSARAETQASSGNTSGSGSSHDSQEQASPSPVLSPVSSNPTGDSDSPGGNSVSGKDTTKVELENHIAEQKQEAEKHAAEAESKAEEVRSKVAGQPQKRLDDSKLKICKNRELGIGNIMGHISNRAQEQFDFYTSVSARAQTFVTDKKLTVTNYDQLLADIATKKSVAEAAIAKLKADKTSFKCDGTNPTGTLDMFRADGEAQNQALNAYRTSVRSLLAAIKAAAQTSATSPAPVTGSTTNNGVKQ